MAKFVLTAEVVLQAPKNVNQVVGNIQSQLNNIQANVSVQGATAANKQIQQLTNSTNQASTAAQKMGKSFTASVRRFSALAIATRAVSLFTNTLGGAIKESIAFERELVKISQVTGKSISGLSKLTTTVSDLSTGLGVSSTSLLSVSRILAQTGLSAKDTQIALGTLARTELAPTFDNISQTAEGAVAILNQFGQGAGALEAQLGSLNAVAGQFAVEAGDLVAAIRRTGGVFKSAGGDLNELIALFTSVRATTRESAESIATGLRTIFTRIQRPETIDYLRQFGVELTDIEGKFVGPYEATRRLSEALAGLGERDLRFVEIAEQLGGFRQIGKVLPLLQQFTVAQNALKAAQEGTGSLATDAAKAQAALAIQITKVKEEFLELVRNFSASTSFQLMADTVLSLASALIKLADTLSPVLPLLTAFAGIKLAGKINGVMGGIGKTLGFSEGGKVEHFARGGMVPGTGNGDTVPAMLTPGEFVIKKSSVKKLGAENLSQMNNGGKVAMYKTGTGSQGAKVSDPAYNIKVADGAVGGFFLNPDKGADREFPINVKGAGRLTNPNVLAVLRGQKDASTEEQLSSLGDAARARVFGGVSKSGKQMIKGSGFGPNTKVKLSEAQGNKEVTFNDLGKEGKDRLKKEVNTASSTTRSNSIKIDKITGKGAGYLPGNDIEQNAEVSGAIAKAATDILKAGVDQATQQIKSLASFGGTIKPNKQAISGADRLAADPNATASVEGFLYEGVIDSITGAQLAGNQAAFDFPFSSIKNNRAGLKRFFSPTGGLENLLNADAKRSFSLAPTIGPKVLGDLNAGNTKGYEIFDSANRSVAKFAKGGAARGQDTVPAMLTPGEFVVNKKSAKSIGYGNLHRMNKAGKYAKGGVVHRFGNGTGSSGVPSGGGAGIDVSGLQSALANLSSSLTDVIAQLQAYSDANVTATESTKNAGKAAKEGGDLEDKRKKGGLEAVVALGVLTTGLNLLTPTIDESSGAFDYLANSVAAGATQLVTFTGLMSQFGGFEALARGLNGITAVTQDVKGSMTTLGKGIKSGLGNVLGFGTAAKAAATANVANSTANTANTVATGGNTAAANASGVSLVYNAVAAMLSAGGLSALAAVVLIVVGGLALLAAGFSIITGAMAGYAKALKDKAVEDGDVEAAGEAAGDEQGWNQLQSSLWSSVTIFGALGETISFFNGDMGRARKAAVSRARADAALSKSAKEVTKAEEDAASAFKEFEAGTRNIGSVLAATAESGKAVIESQREVAAANMEAQRAVVTFWSSLGSGLKAFFGTSFGLSTIEDNQKKADAEGEARNNEQEKREVSYVAANAPATNALMKQVAAAGGSIEDFYARLESQNESLYKLIRGTEATEKAFENITAEAERTREAFEAMNLGFQSVQASAGALQVGVDNLLRGMEGGTSQLESTLATLEAGLSNAAQGMSDGDWNKAMGEATAALEGLGATKEQVDKFKGNLNGINAAQKFYADAVQETKDKLMAEFKAGRSTGGGSSKDNENLLKEAIVNQIPDELGPDIKKRILAGLKGIKISDKDMERFANNDFDVVDELLAELGDDTLSQVIKSFETLIAVDNERLKIVKKLVKLEEALIDARQKTLDVEIEARGLEEKYGGRKFSAEEQKGLIFEKGNQREGLPKLTTGSREEFEARNKFMADEAKDIGETKLKAARRVPASVAELKTEEFKQRDAALESFTKDEIALKRELLKVIDSEIKAIKAKEAAEKKSADALLGNSWEQAAEEMAAQGAMAAASLGDSNLMSGFSRTDYGRASKNLDEMKKAGVKDIYGKDIDEVNVRARTEGLTRAGVGRDRAEEMARKGIGQSDEVKDKNQEALDIVKTMTATQEIQTGVVESQIAVERELITEMLLLKKAVVANTKARRGETDKSSEEGGDKDSSGKGSKSGSGSGGSGSGSDGMKSSSTSSMSHSDCCCGGVSDVRVVNTGDFDTEAQKADTNSKSLAGIVAENPVMISVAKRAIDSKPLVKAVKNALTPAGKAIKNTAKATFQAAKKVMPKGRPKPVSSLDPDFIGPRDFIGPKPADAADAAKAAAATKAASKTPVPPPVEKPLPPPPRSVKAAQEQIIGSRGPQSPDIPAPPVDTKALDAAKTRKANAATKLQQVDNLDVNKLPAQVKKIVARVKPNKGKDTAKLIEEILSEVRPGADGLTDISRKADMGILSKGNQNIDLDKLMKSAMDNMNWDADKLYNNLISSWSGDMTPSYNSLETGRMTGFKESRLPEMQAEFTKNTGIDPKGMGSAYDEYADATKKVSDLQAAAPSPSAANQAVPPPSPKKTTVPPPVPPKGTVPPPVPPKSTVPPPLPVQEQSTASKVLDSVTEAVKSKVNSGLDAVKGVPEIAKGIKESLKAKLPNVSMPEFKMPDLGIKDFVDGFRATEGVVDTTPVSKAGLDELLEPEVLGKMGQAGADASKGLKKFLTILGPVADIADVAVGVYTGITRTEETRGNLGIDKGLDDQNTLYKGLIGGLSGTPTMGGSVTSLLSGLVGGPQTEIGSTTDLALSGGEAVARGASIGATVGLPFGPAGVAVGAAGGAVIGGSAELVKAIGFLQQAVEESTKSAEKAEGLRNASKDETGLDVVVRNLVGANANAKLDLEEAKASGDKDKIASAESNLKNTQQALDNNIQQRREKGGDLRGTVFTSGRPKVEAELKKQQAFSDKVVAANRQARADEAKAAEARAAVVKENKKAASQESTGQFDYRTGLPTQTMFDIPKEEKKDPEAELKALMADVDKTLQLDPKTVVAQMTADREAREAAEVEEQARLNEANITTPTVKVEAQNMEDGTLEQDRINNLASTPEQLKNRGIKSIYTYDDGLTSSDEKQPGDVKERTPEWIAEGNRMASESMDRSLGGNQDYAVDNNRITPSEGFPFSDQLNSNYELDGEAPVSDKIAQKQATVPDSVPTAAIEAPPAPGEQAMKTPASESSAGGAGTIAGAMGEVDPERQAKIKQMEEGAAEAAETKKEDLPKKEQEAIAEALSSKEQPTNTGDCCSQTLEILKQILEAIKNIGQYDPSELGSMTVANPEAIAKATEKVADEKESANDAAKVKSELDKTTRKALGIKEGKTLQEQGTTIQETKELQEAKKEEQEEYKEPRNNLGLTASQDSQLERTARSETASGKLGRLAGASGAGSKFNQRMQDKEQRIIDQEKYKSAQEFTAGLDDEEKKEVALGFDTKQENPFLAKGDYDNQKSNNYAQMQQQKRIAYAQKTGGRLRSEDENFLKFENDRKIASSIQSNERNKKPEDVSTAYASSVEKTMEAGTGKFDINTQKEITNPFLPLVDSIDKDLKVAKEAGDSEKEKALLDEKALTQAASDVYTNLNPERKASDDIALSGNFYKDAIVLLKAILDAVSNCCGGGGTSSELNVQDLFNFTKTYDESQGQGVPQGVPVDSLGYKDIFKQKETDKTLQETETDDRSPSRAALLSPPKKPKELTTGGAYDNGQFSAGNPFIKDVSGMRSSKLPEDHNGMGRIERIKGEVGGGVGGQIVDDFMKSMQGMIPTTLPEESSGMGAMERMTGDLLNLGETNQLLISIETVLHSIVSNTQPQNVQNEQNQNQDDGGLISDLSSITNSFQTIFSSFTNEFTNAIARLENVSIEIKVQPLNVTVDLNGGGVLDKLKSYVGDEMIDAIAKEIKTYKVGANNKLSKGQSTLANGGGGGS